MAIILAFIGSCSPLADISQIIVITYDEGEELQAGRLPEDQ